MRIAALPRIGLSVGDPAGIGPEIAERSARDPRVTEVCEPLVYRPESGRAGGAFQPGVATAAGGQAACDVVCRAAADALSGRLDGIVTGPINKTALRLAGLPWRGHTDLLAHLTGASDVAMMFHADRLRVVLATVHIPLAEGAGAAHAPTGRTDDRIGGVRAALVRLPCSPSRGCRSQPARGRAGHHGQRG